MTNPEEDDTIEGHSTITVTQRTIYDHALLSLFKQRRSFNINAVAQRTIYNHALLSLFKQRTKTVTILTGNKF